jgi:hypothetical protein
MRAEIERYVQKARDTRGRDRMRANTHARLRSTPRPGGLRLSTSHNLAFIGSELGGTREIVKNAALHGDAVSETVQVLQDGNRIVKRTTTKLARDTYGRTRRRRPGRTAASRTSSIRSTTATFARGAPARCASRACRTAGARADLRAACAGVRP